MSVEKSENMDDAGQDFDPYGDASPMPDVAHQEPEILIARHGASPDIRQEPKNVTESPVNGLPRLEAQIHLQSATKDADLQHQVSSNSSLPGLDLNHTLNTFSRPKAIADTGMGQLNGTLIKDESSQGQGIAQQKEDSVGETDKLESQGKASSVETTAKTEILDAEIALQDISIQAEDANGDKAPEVEYDSSAAESSSDETSSADSDDSDGSEEDYELLDPVEQARRLMEGDGSDDEGGKAATGGSLRTANEKEDEVIEIPKIEMTPETKIEELGKIEAVIENMILIKAKTSGEYQVLESGSVLCTLDRVIVGVVAETLGRVQEPMYCVRFSNAQSITALGLERSMAIYYIPEHSYFVFTQALQGIKGSDASNINDEEVGGDEIEFSDDEAEAEYKRQKKLERQERKGPRGGSSRGRADMSRGASRAQEHHIASSLPYDDVNMDDQLYTPLVRPSSLNTPGQFVSEEQGNNGYSRGVGGMRGFVGRGRGGNRGRANRNGHHGGRQQTGVTTAQSMPPYGFAQQQQHQYSQQQVAQPQISYQVQAQAFQPPHPYSQYSQAQFPGQQHPFPPQFTNQNTQWMGFPQQPQQVPFQANSSQNSISNLPPGAFYNPVFFTNQPGNPPGNPPG